MQLFAQSHHAHLNVGFLLFTHGHTQALRNLDEVEPGVLRLAKRLQQSGLGGREPNRARWTGQIEFVK